MAAVKFLCHWCRKEIPQHHPYRTLEDQVETGTGWFVCGEECPKRPEGAKVFIR